MLTTLLITGFFVACYIWYHLIFWTEDELWEMLVGEHWQVRYMPDWLEWPYGPLMALGLSLLIDLLFVRPFAIGFFGNAIGILLLTNTLYALMVTTLALGRRIYAVLAFRTERRASKLRKNFTRFMSKGEVTPNAVDAVRETCSLGAVYCSQLLVRATRSAFWQHLTHEETTVLLTEIVACVNNTADAEGEPWFRSNFVQNNDWILHSMTLPFETAPDTLLKSWAGVFFRASRTVTDEEKGSIGTTEWLSCAATFFASVRQFDVATHLAKRVSYEYGGEPHYCQALAAVASQMLHHGRKSQARSLLDEGYRVAMLDRPARRKESKAHAIEALSGVVALLDEDWLARLLRKASILVSDLDSQQIVRRADGTEELFRDVGKEERRSLASAKEAYCRLAELQKEAGDDALVCPLCGMVQDRHRTLDWCWLCSWSLKKYTGSRGRELPRKHRWGRI